MCVDVDVDVDVDVSVNVDYSRGCGVVRRRGGLHPYFALHKSSASPPILSLRCQATSLDRDWWV